MRGQIDGTEHERQTAWQAARQRLLDLMNPQTQTPMCSACHIRPDAGRTWRGPWLFGRVVTLTGLCDTCGTLGPERTPPTVTDRAECGCSPYGRCSYHAATDKLGTDVVAEWRAAGNESDAERAERLARVKAGTPRVVVVDGSVAGRVMGEESVLEVTWMPDGRAEVWYIDHTADIPAPARLVPVGLMTTDADMREVLVNRERWSSWTWRGQAHMVASARTVCSTCRATYSVKRVSKHVCGETVDSRGRARLDPEVRRMRQVAGAAQARVKVALRLGRKPASVDVEAIERAGLEVPTL